MDLKTEDIDKIVLAIADKLSDLSYIENIAERKENCFKIMGQELNTFDKYSLSSGISSLCIFFGELSKIYQGRGFDRVAHNYLSIMVDYIKENPSCGISMFSGLPGIGLAAMCMSSNGSYQGFINQLNSLIVSKTETKIEHIKEVGEIREEYYDVMYGFSGVVNYCTLFRDSQSMMETLKHIVSYLIDICSPKIISGTSVPGVIVSNKNSPFRGEDTNLPYVNLGLSHGIPGILVSLCKSYKLGIRLPNQKETIRMLSDFIKCCGTYSKDIGLRWDSAIYLGRNSFNPNNGRDAWCYGNPGIAYSLLIAGEVLQDEELIDISIDSMRLSLKEKIGVSSPTFCHGMAGIAYVSKKFFDHTGLDYFKEEAIKISNAIIDQYNENVPFGFKSNEFIGGETRNLDDAGLLTGTVGTLLAILAINRGKISAWDAAFCLNDL